MKTSLSLLFLLLGFVSIDTLTQNNSPKAEQLDKAITLHIEGMNCQFCARNLKNSLEELDGVAIHKIDPKEGVAKLSFEQDRAPSNDQLKESVESAGFVLKKIERKQEEQSSSKNPNQ